MTFTTKEIIGAVLDKFTDEFSPNEIKETPTMQQLGDGTWLISYESEVPQ